MAENTTKHNFLEGGGDMGRLVRAKDWSKTPIGNPETWPESLQIMVSVMLNNPFPMYIAWGKDYTQIYNDGYRPILGTNKHPHALGASSKETYSEIWDVVEPLFADVMRGESVSDTNFMLHLNRNGFVEECYFDFAYCPIRLTSGEVGGILTTITETTSKIKAEAELKDSNTELEFVIEASQLGTFDHNPRTHKFSGNTRMEKWFGLAANEEIDVKEALDCIAPNDRQRVSDAINAASDPISGGYYDIEYTVINRITKKETIVHAKGKAWFNQENIAHRLNGTLEDVTERVLARKKIEESERSFRLLILQAPVAISIFRGPDFKIEIANQYALDLWNRTEEEVLSYSVFEAIPELLSQGVKELLVEVSRTGKRYSILDQPLQFLRDGILHTKYVSASYEALYDTEGHINGIMGIGHDVTAQVMAHKRIEESEQHIRSLVESAPFPIGVFVGEEMRISLANQSIMDTWGKGNEVIGKLFSDVLPEFENQHIYDQIRSVLHTGIPFHAKNQKIDIVKEGQLKTFYFNYSLTPLMDAHGKVQSVMNTAADTTELNEAKYKIEESEKRFREAVKQAPLGITILRGPENIVEIANATYLQVIDQTESQFVGKPLFESLPQIEDTISTALLGIYNTGEAFYSYEFPVHLKRKGQIELCYFNLVYHPLKENKAITGIMVVATEVTATVKAKLQIEENEEKLLLILDGSDLGVFEWYLDQKNIIISDHGHEILGFSINKEVTLKDVRNTIHPDDLAINLEALKKSRVDGKLNYQSRLLWNDQSVHWIEVKGKVFFDEHGNPVRILGTLRDITKEQTFQQQLLEREEKFRLLADSLPQQVWTADPKGQLNYWNKTVFDYSGLSLDDLISKGWPEMVHPEDRRRNIERWSKAVNSSNEFLIEHRFRKSTGEFRWHLSRAIPQKDEDGNIKMWVGSSTDIQDQKMFTTELENKVQQRTNELQKKNLDLKKMNKELQSFVYISSHDLQEPLRKIQTFASRILEVEYESLSDTAKKYFTRMQKSAFRMQNLIQDLIAYSRTNVQESNLETIDLSEVIEDLKETLSEELEKNHVTFNIHKICSLKVIPVQFKQVMHNLISNSIKFARVDHPVVIDINCEKIEGKNIDLPLTAVDKVFYHIRYSDNGIGFEPQYNTRIFEVFQRLHSKDEYSGTGIGLAIVKRIIENHDGVIFAQGELNKGARFDIYLPAE